MFPLYNLLVTLASPSIVFFFYSELGGHFEFESEAHFKLFRWPVTLGFALTTPEIYVQYRLHNSINTIL